MKTSKKDAVTAPQLSEQQQRQRRFYLVLPVLILPFLTIAFWALGGGKSEGQATMASRTPGLDATLPEAKFKQETGKSKMALYQETKPSSDTVSGISPEFLNALGNSGLAGTGKEVRVVAAEEANSPEAQSKKIDARLAQINRQLQEPPSGRVAADEPVRQETEQKIRKLNKMVNGASHAAPDPEMQQLSQMLKQIQAIQNPASVQLANASATAPAKPFRAIPAIIDGKQKVADGAAVKLRLTDTVTIKGQLLHKGQEIFGVCQVTNQRLLLNVQHIRLETQIVPVSITVFSQDGMPGIPAPEAELTGISASNADQTLQSMQILSMDQSIAGQAAAGGINAAKDLFSKKVKKIKVKLSDGYPVLLKINK